MVAFSGGANVLIFSDRPFFLEAHKEMDGVQIKSCGEKGVMIGVAGR
jgi:hypothetical protein